jgi:U3 small nucleolar RNA-associated protein 14
VKELKEKKRASVQNSIDLRAINNNCKDNYDEDNNIKIDNGAAATATSIHVVINSDSSSSSSSSSSNSSNSSSGISYDDRYLTALQRMEMKKQQYENEKVSFSWRRYSSFNMIDMTNFVIHFCISVCC